MGTNPVTASNLRIRKTFAKNKQVIDIPNLIELQKSSYESFLQKDVDPDRRGDDGLNGVNPFSRSRTSTTRQASSLSATRLNRQSTTSMNVVSVA
jgi:DNA-directed RNA polymerase beta subunit